MANSYRNRERFMGDSGYLIHFGIKGQKWGLRRFQNEDGTLTEEGMRRYGITDSRGQLNPSYKVKADYRNRKIADSTFKNDIRNEKKQNKPISKRRQELIEKYKQKGLTQEQAEIQALRRENTEKIIKVAGAVALTAAITYGAYKGHQWLAKNADKTIKAGADIYRTTGSPGTDLTNHAGYVALNPKDAQKYRGVYGNQIKMRKAIQNAQSRILGKATSNDNVYAMIGKARSNIKVAGNRKAKKVYSELMKNDKDFASDNRKMMDRWKNLMGSNSSDSYIDFNTRLVDHDAPEALRVRDKFYNALKAKGYGGVIDVNDRDYSGFHAKNPTILFNMKESISNISKRKLSDIDIAADYQKGHALMAKQAIRDVKINEVMKSVRNYGGYFALLAGGGAVGNKVYDRKVSRSGSYQKSIIKQYKKEHPNTKLKDAEILENLLWHA